MEFWGYCWLTGGQTQAPGSLASGSQGSWSWCWSAGGMSKFLTQLAAESRVSWSLCQPTSEWGQVPGQLGEDSKVSQSWCWPLEGWARSCLRRLWGCSGPGTSVCLLGGAWAQEILGLVPTIGGWSWVPGCLASGPTGGSGWGMRVLIPGLLPPCW